MDTSPFRQALERIAYINDPQRWHANKAYQIPLEELSKLWTKVANLAKELQFEERVEALVPVFYEQLLRHSMRHVREFMGIVGLRMEVEETHDLYDEIAQRFPDEEKVLRGRYVDGWKRTVYTKYHMEKGFNYPLNAHFILKENGETKAAREAVKAVVSCYLLNSSRLEICSQYKLFGESWLDPIAEAKVAEVVKLLSNNHTLGPRELQPIVDGLSQLPWGKKPWHVIQVQDFVRRVQELSLAPPKYSGSQMAVCIHHSWYSQNPERTGFGYVDCGRDLESWVERIARPLLNLVLPESERKAFLKELKRINQGNRELIDVFQSWE